MLELVKTYLKTKDASEVMRILLNCNIDTLEAAKLIVEALETPSKITWNEGTGEFDETEYQSWEAFNNILWKLGSEHDKDGYTGRTGMYMMVERGRT